MSIMDVLLRKSLADDFITHDSHRYAKQVAQDIREKTDVLEQLPKIGKKYWKSVMGMSENWFCWTLLSQRVGTSGTSLVTVQPPTPAPARARETLKFSPWGVRSRDLENCCSTGTAERPSHSLS